MTAQKVQAKVKTTKAAATPKGGRKTASTPTVAAKKETKRKTPAKKAKPVGVRADGLEPTSKYAKRKDKRNPTSSNVNSKAAVAAAIKKDNALKLRIKGYSYSEIGTAMGFSRVYAYKIVRDAMDEVHRGIQETAIDVKAMELMRLDNMFMTAAAIMTDSQKDGYKLQAIDRMAKCMERRAKLLNLDEVIMTTEDEEEIREEFL